MDANHKYELPVMRSTEWTYCGNKSCNILVNIKHHLKKFKAGFWVDEEINETYEGSNIVKCPVCEDIIYAEKDNN